MWTDVLKNFVLTYGILGLILFLSFCIALPAASEIQYKHRNKVFTRLAQALTTLLYTAIITAIVLAVTSLL